MKKMKKYANEDQSNIMRILEHVRRFKINCKVRVNISLQKHLFWDIALCFFGVSPMKHVSQGMEFSVVIRLKYRMVIPYVKTFQPAPSVLSQHRDGSCQ
jgi:hypothetical protein